MAYIHIIERIVFGCAIIVEAEHPNLHSAARTLSELKNLADQKGNPSLSGKRI
jgi:hypothetical protein